MVRSAIDCKVDIVGDRWPSTIAMDNLVLSLIVFCSASLVSCQYEQNPGSFQRRPPSNILLHKQALGQDGSFNYAFAADNGLRQGEVIDPDGNRRGSYSYVDPNGKTVTLSYTAGKDGFRVLNGDHLPKAPEPQQQRPNPQYYQPQQPGAPQHSQPPPEYPLFRPNPVPFDAYRNSPDAPAYRGPAPAPGPHNHRPPLPAAPLAGPPAPYDPAYARPPQPPHHAPQLPRIPRPHHYSVEEGDRERPAPYFAQQFSGDYRQEDPRKPHSFGGGGGDAEHLRFDGREERIKMKSCQDLLGELREKVRVAEDNLRSEKKNLFKIQELFSDDRTKWAAEIREEERKVRANELQRKQKEAELASLRAEFDAVTKKAAGLEEENEKIARELQKAKGQHGDQMNVFLLERSRLERELQKLQEQLKDLQGCNKWTKMFQAKELSTHESDQESTFKEEFRQLSDDFARKMDAYNESLKEIDLASLEPKKEKLASLREKLKALTDECKEYELKNKSLERQIELLDKS